MRFALLWLHCASQLPSSVYSQGWQAGQVPETRRQVGRAGKTQLLGDYDLGLPLAWPNLTFLP